MIYRVGENICKWSDWQGINIQNIQTAHMTQLKNKQTNKPQITQSKMGRRPKETFAQRRRSESESLLVVSTSLQPHGLYSPWNSPGQNTGMGSFSLLQGNLPNPGIKPRSPALQADSLPVEPQGKPKNDGMGSLSLLQWIFLTQEWNNGLLNAGGFFTNWAMREAP